MQEIWQEHIPCFGKAYSWGERMWAAAPMSPSLPQFLQKWLEGGKKQGSSVPRNEALAGKAVRNSWVPPAHPAQSPGHLLNEMATEHLTTTQQRPGRVSNSFSSQSHRQKGCLHHKASLGATARIWGMGWPMLSILLKIVSCPPLNLWLPLLSAWQHPR